MTNIQCQNSQRHCVIIKNRLKRFKLKLLFDTKKVSVWHIKQYIKEKVKSKGMITKLKN